MLFPGCLKRGSPVIWFAISIKFLDDCSIACFSLILPFRTLGVSFDHGNEAINVPCAGIDFLPIKFICIDRCSDVTTSAAYEHFAEILRVSRDKPRRIE